MSTGVPDGFLGLDIGPKSIEMNDEAGLFVFFLFSPKGLDPDGGHWPVRVP